MNPKIIFISGIDTDVGKTFYTGYYAKCLMNMGRGVITQKLVQTGCEGVSDDIRTHRRIQGIGMMPEDYEGKTCRFIYKYPCSPHMAMALENRPLNLEQIYKDTLELSKSYEYVLLEGAGGLMAPLTEEVMTLDFIATYKLPVILVTNGKLGSINHALLSLMACDTMGIQVQKVVFNKYLMFDPKITNNTIEFLRGYIEKKYPQTQFEEFEGIDIN